MSLMSLIRHGALQRLPISVVTAWGKRNMSQQSVNALRQVMTDELHNMKQAGTYKSERIITSKQSRLVTVQGRDTPVLNFCANNYLGLSDDSRVIESAIEALHQYASGLSSVRFICGTMDIHKSLEAKISTFHGTEDTILYPSCFDANGGLFEAILTADDAVISDELNHASIIDGVRLCKAKRHRYKHRDLEDLERQLKDTQSCRTRLIATDGVFSMDGNVAPLPAICELADRYNAIVLVDDCHATGFLGKTGRGTDEFTGVRGRVDIINSTLGKALGGAAGGYTTGPREVIDVLRNKSRPYLFSNSLPPAVVGAASRVFDILMSNSELVERLAANTKHFRQRMTSAGFSIAGDDHPIAPVMLGDAKLAADLADDLLKKDIYVIGFSYPVVPKGKARIRVQLSAAHTTEDVDRAVDAFVECGRAHKIIP